MICSFIQKEHSSTLIPFCFTLMWCSKEGNIEFGNNWEHFWRNVCFPVLETDTLNFSSPTTGGIPNISGKPERLFLKIRLKALEMCCILWCLMVYFNNLPCRGFKKSNLWYQFPTCSITAFALLWTFLRRTFSERPFFFNLASSL